MQGFMLRFWTIDDFLKLVYPEEKMFLY